MARKKNISLYNIASDSESLRSSLEELRSDYDSHNHDGSSSKHFETLILETLRARDISIRKNTFSDTTAGLWMGLSDNVMKLSLGDSTNYLLWTGTALSIVGSITATTGTIGGWSIGSTTLSGANLTLDSAGTVRQGKTTFTNTDAGFILGDDAGTAKLYIGNSTAYLNWTGTALTLQGATLTAGTIQTASTGERIALVAATKDLQLINSSGSTVAKLYYGTATTAAILSITPANEGRKGIEFVIPSNIGSDAKCITIDNPSTSICIDITDGGSTAISIAGQSTTAINITHAGTGAGINISASGSGAGALTIGGGDYPSIDITQDGTSTNSYGIRISDSTAFLKSSIYVDNNANSHLSEGIEIERDGNADNQIIRAISIKATNSGVGGKACGIDFTYGTIQAIMNVAADATDPTGGGGAATGRIPIYVAGNLKYLAYY